MCPLCGSKDFTFFHTLVHGVWVKLYICARCGIVYKELEHDKKNDNKS